MRNMSTMSILAKYESSGERLKGPIYPESSLVVSNNRRPRWLVPALISGLWLLTIFLTNPWPIKSEVRFNWGHTTSSEPKADQVVRRYNVTVGARWMNLGQFRGAIAC